MSEIKRRLVEQLLDPSFVEGLERRTIDELKDMRGECREADNELSFERRLCQARIEILRAELDRREQGGAEADLMSRLPQILAAEAVGAEGSLPARAPDHSVPRSADVPRRRVDELIGEQTIARLPQLGDDEIRSVAESLEAHESQVSARRKEVHRVMDTVQEEIVRRFRSGEADPTAALG